MRVFIDPGHGGADPGAVGYVTEEVINLEIALMLKKILEKENHAVSMSRSDDRAVAISQRAKMANLFNADVFISIHCNSASNRKARGFEVFYCEGSERGKELAERVHEMVTVNLGVQDRGIKPDTQSHVGRLGVLRNTKMPAILIEVGFVSNPDDAKLIDNNEFENAICVFIAEALANFGRK